jgi:hypothetical protein
MKLRYTQNALDTPTDLPAPTRKAAFYTQAAFLVQNIQHPSLHAKKYDKAGDKWQARVNRSWRFYFRIDAYVVSDIIPHPK